MAASDGYQTDRNPETHQVTYQQQYDFQPEFSGNKQ